MENWTEIDRILIGRDRSLAPGDAILLSGCPNYVRGWLSDLCNSSCINS